VVVSRTRVLFMAERCLTTEPQKNQGCRLRIQQPNSSTNEP